MYDLCQMLLLKGYARKNNQQNSTTEKGRVWYLPHHGINNPCKPDKNRVVFDYSVRYESESLKGYLMQGPDLPNKLVGVLTRSRQEKFAFMADTKQMFNQVKVKRKDQHFVCFLWWLTEAIQPNLQNTVWRYIFSAVYRSQDSQNSRWNEWPTIMKVSLGLKQHQSA